MTFEERWEALGTEEASLDWLRECTTMLEQKASQPERRPKQATRTTFRSYRRCRRAQPRKSLSPVSSWVQL